MTSKLLKFAILGALSFHLLGFQSFSYAAVQEIVVVPAVDKVWTKLGDIKKKQGEANLFMLKDIHTTQDIGVMMTLSAEYAKGKNANSIPMETARQQIENNLKARYSNLMSNVLTLDDKNLIMTFQSISDPRRGNTYIATRAVKGNKAVHMVIVIVKNHGDFEKALAALNSAKVIGRAPVKLAKA